MYVSKHLMGQRLKFKLDARLARTSHFILMKKHAPKVSFLKKNARPVTHTLKVYILMVYLLIILDELSSANCINQADLNSVVQWSIVDNVV